MTLTEARAHALQILADTEKRMRDERAGVREMPEDKKLMTIDEYRKQQQEITDAPRLSGIACPQCGAEMCWGEQSMFPTNPPMKRLNCVECEYSEVVPI